MPTTVGTQKTETGVLTAAVQLEMDCVAAYHQATQSLKDQGLADNFEAMEKDCQRHITAWQGRLVALDAKPAARNGLSAPLNRFKMKLASMFGVGAMHRAVQNNPVDCGTAYKRVAERADLSAQTRELAKSFQPDAAKHAQWVADMVGHAGQANSATQHP